MGMVKANIIRKYGYYNIHFFLFWNFFLLSKLGGDCG